MRYVPNPHLIDELRRSLELLKECHEEGEKIAEVARRIVPRGDSPAGQHYSDQITVETVSMKGIPTTQVVANKGDSVQIEFGTSDTPTFAPLRKAAMSRRR